LLIPVFLLLLSLSISALPSLASLSFVDGVIHLASMLDLSGHHQPPAHDLYKVIYIHIDRNVYNSHTNHNLPMYLATSALVFIFFQLVIITLFIMLLLLLLAFN